MEDKDRRSFLKTGGMALATGVVGSLAIAATAAEQEEFLKGKRGGEVFVVSGDKEGVCGTCRFWGGVRRAAEDKKTVYCESLGWCNNPDSPNYQSKTTPVTGPMKAWRKWEALS